MLEELTEHGYRALSVEGVAQRSGVHKTTLYRRWGSIDALLAEAATEAMDDAVPIPDSGDLTEDLTELGMLIAENLKRPLTQELIRLLASDRESRPWLRDAATAFWRHRAELTAGLVERAVARGDLPAGTEAAAVLEALIAPLYLRLLVTRRPLDAAAVRAAAATAALAGRGGLLSTPIGSE